MKFIILTIIAVALCGWYESYKNKDDPNIKIAYLPDGTRCAIWLANGIGAGGISCDWR
jgi:hypothetical protein